MGVVGAGFDPTGGEVASMSPQGWMCDTASGSLWHAGRASRWEALCAGPVHRRFGIGTMFRGMDFLPRGHDFKAPGPRSRVW